MGASASHGHDEHDHRVEESQERPELSLCTPSNKYVWRVVDLIHEETPSDMLDALLKDGRVFADFVSFVGRFFKPEVVLDVWALDMVLRGEWVEMETSGVHRLFNSLHQDTLGSCLEAVSRLTPVFQQYQSAEPHRRIDDANFWEWEQWGPSPDVISSLTRKSSSPESSPAHVGEDHDMYTFSVAAMTGMHSAMTCSDVVRRTASMAAGDPSNLKGEFQRRYPGVDYEAIQRTCVRSYFIPPGGSAYSPRTMLSDAFAIDEICPDLTAEVRDLCAISDDDFFESVCRTDFAFIEFGANSKSKEFFFFSHDEKYLLKTMTGMEAEVLASMLPGLIARLAADPRTMLGKYCGMFRVHVEEEQRLFFIMRNVKTHDLPIGCSYDIKGSEMNRTAGPTDSVGKDNDFWQEIGALPLHPQLAREVAEVHRQDMDLLRDCRVMDFSLLIQMHDRKGLLSRGDGLPPAITKVQIQDNGRNGRLSRLKQKLHSLGHWDGEDDEASSDGHRTRGGMSLVPPPPGAGHDMHHRVELWDPSDGSICSADGRFVYTFGLIDMLVPFDWYNPRGQYVANTVLSCGNPDLYSRVPPDIYCDRQVAAVHELCGLEVPEEE